MNISSIVPGKTSISHLASESTTRFYRNKGPHFFGANPGRTSYASPDIANAAPGGAGGPNGEPVSAPGLDHTDQGPISRARGAARHNEAGPSPAWPGAAARQAWYGRGWARQRDCKSRRGPVLERGPAFPF
jgi:hypothetical protein